MNKTRPKQLSFRVNEEEYQQLQEKITESGKNQQEYILSCVLGKQIVNTDGIKELIPELKRIMGFPENYVLIGTQEEQKKFIGNAVEVNMARVLCEALVAKLYELNITPQRFAA